MMDAASAAVERIVSIFPEAVIAPRESCGQKYVDVRRDRIIDLLSHLKGELKFECLTDLTAVDCMNQGAPERFCVVYQLYCYDDNQYFRVKAYVPEDDPSIDSATGLWKAANWAEREVWDLYGIEFRGHPDLKRLMLPEYYTGHPLRKDYPLRGLGERDNFPRYVGGA